MFNKVEYQKIFIVDDSAYFDSVKSEYNSNADLVLSFDFGLVKQLRNENCEVHYVDHLIPAEYMQKENHNIYDFFNRWHKNSEGKDFFNYLGLDFGFVFRQEIWNDFTYSIRLLITLSTLKSITFKKVLLGTNDPILKNVLDYKKIPYQKVAKKSSKSTYYFPMSRWMDNAIRPSDLKSKIRNQIYYFIPWIIYFLQKIKLVDFKKPLVFVQNYHPTKAIVERLKADGQVTVCLERFTNYSSIKSYIEERPIPLSKIKARNVDNGKKLIENFQKNRDQKFNLLDETDITEFLMEIIIKRIEPRISYYLSLIDSITFYFDRVQLKLEVIITNVGIFTGLLHEYCQKNKKINLLILNGLLGEDFMDESKYAMVINGYSKSIKENYFLNDKKVLCLGDPRMDFYTRLEKRVVNKKKTTISIGSSNFNNIDLNSFSAAEFEFLHDVLSVLDLEIKKGRDIDLIIKVRANGYKYQYVNFVNEYFPHLKIQVLDTIPMFEVLLKTDFYITLYSQTLFEASALGIPVVYYKSDVEIKQTPFDTKCELVTPENKKQLEEVVEAFFNGSNIFDGFLKKEVMERFIGPLDGKNLDRNMDLIYSLLDCKNETDVLDLADRMNA